MIKPLSKILNQNCLFRTDRVSIMNWRFLESRPGIQSSLAERVLKIMTPNVTKALPDGWQNIDTIEKAENWIVERKADSDFYAVTINETGDSIGYLFLYVDNEIERSCEIRFGYLLMESHWGKGIGSELIKGLVDWCANTKIIRSLSGGVEKENIGSIRVLEKNGFYRSTEELPGEMFLYKMDF